MNARMGSPDGPMDCTAKPQSSATKRTWSTEPDVKDENSVSGMIDAMKPVRPSWLSSA